MVFRKDSFKVKLHGRSGVIYEEAGRAVMIEAEMLAEEIDLVIYADSIKHWLPPHENEVISQDEKNMIRLNVTTALQKKGMVVEWD